MSELTHARFEVIITSGIEGYPLIALDGKGEVWICRQGTEGQSIVLRDWFRLEDVEIPN